MHGMKLKMMGTGLTSILFGIGFSATAHAQTTKKPPVNVKKPPIQTLPSQNTPMNLPLVINPQSQQNTAEPRDRLQMSCRGPAKKWTIAETRSGSRAGTWSVLAWYDAAPAGQNHVKAGECKPYGDSAGFRRYESDPHLGITLRYNAPLRSEPISKVTFENGQTQVDINRSAMNSDRNMRFMYDNILRSSGDAFVWGERAGNAGSGIFGKIWDVKNVDREHGYRFPEGPF